MKYYNKIKKSVGQIRKEMIYMENKKSEFISWVKKHRVMIVSGIGITALTVGVICISKNVDCIKLTKNTYKTPNNILPIPTNSNVEIDFSVDLTGNKMIPTALGNKISKSPQQINKLLCEKGFQIKLPDGSYLLTEIGKKFGTEVWKTTRYGHNFINIEWDEKILDYLTQKTRLIKK